MNEVTLRVAVGCVLQIAESTFAPDAPGPDGQVGWVEETRLEVLAEPTCPWVELGLPRDAVLGERKAKQKLGDGTGTKLGPERWELSPRAIDGTGVVRLHTPELLGGDRVVVTFERHLPPGPIVYRPGRVRYVAVEVEGGTVTDSAGKGGPALWASEPPADWTATIDGEPGLVGTAVPLAAGDVQVDRWLVLEVPPGDPLMQLYPGGGSTVSITEKLAFPPADEERTWPLSAPPGAVVTVASEPAELARVEQDRGGSRLVVASTDVTTTATVSWRQPDAPTFGAKDDARSLVVDVKDGKVRWDGDFWYLERVRDRIVVPSREKLVAALDNRFRTAAFPEPGAPIELRGQPVTWDTAAELRPALLQRVAIGRWPTDPLFPRRLTKARKALALTPVEAGLTLWLYAVQLHFDADWALVRPAPAGPGPEAVPVGYDTVLVRFRRGDEVRWVDPACSVCAPFELPPALEGAAVYGPGEVRATPGPTPGAVEATFGDEVVWKVHGPPALALRLALQDLPADQRAAEIAHRLGGPGAELKWTQGLDQAGSDVLLQVAAHGGIGADPLGLPAPNDAGTVWVDWVGERVARWPDRETAEVHVDDGPLHYARTREDGKVVERLTVDQRELDGAAVARIVAARAEPAPAPPIDPPPISPPGPAPAPP